MRIKRGGPLTLNGMNSTLLAVKLEPSSCNEPFLFASSLAIFEDLQKYPCSPQPYVQMIGWGYGSEQFKGNRGMSTSQPAIDNGLHGWLARKPMEV